ncbi:hypothetical protein [Azospirillum sp.]|uniref:hypothetical protein n=1 Tax=Azospirillum sp. TaxID=34012 RepID=UPI003D74EE92
MSAKPDFMKDLPEMFTASVAAKYIPVLAAFAGDFEIPRVQGIYIEPVETGVVLVATDGHTICAFHDETGHATRPIRAVLPPHVIDACRRPKLPRPFDMGGGEWEVDPPGWMLPGKLFLHTAGCWVQTAADPSEDPDWTDESASVLAHAIIETGNVWRADDYRIIDKPYVTWRASFQPTAASVDGMTVNTALISRFGALSDLHPQGACLTLNFAGSAGPITVTSIAIPEFIGAVMPMRLSNTRPLPEWARMTAAEAA